MDLLKERILKDGKIGDGGVLRVNEFLNHLVDTQLLYEIGKAMAGIFRKCQPTKIITIEASGIPIAAFCALELQIPFIIAKKHSPTNLPTDTYNAEVFSYTKKAISNIRVSKDVIHSSDRILIVDDFLARGGAVNGLMTIVKEANATLVGVGICIEKSFQQGASGLITEGVNLHSLVKIKSLENGTIIFMP